MFELIEAFDLELLFVINQKFQHSFLDQLFPYFTNLHKIYFIKVFILPLFFCFWIYKAKSKALKVIFALVITAGVSDLAGYRLLKPSFKRVRPNNNVIVEPQIRTLRTPGSFSFPSNHSMNSFAVCTVASFYFPFLAGYLFPFALLIGLFRVYAGVHYPTDILGGAVFGIIIGYLLYKYIFRKYSFFKIRP